MMSEKDHQFQEEFDCILNYIFNLRIEVKIILFFCTKILFVFTNLQYVSKLLVFDCYAIVVFQNLYFFLFFVFLKSICGKSTALPPPMVQYRYDNIIYSYIDIFYRKFKK
jgi:hypothetical protein